MGLYNFDKRFVHKILSGEKQHTIRATRAHPDKVGNTLHLYSGLRTKSTKLLMRARCVLIQEIVINRYGVNDSISDFCLVIDGIELNSTEKQAFARRDGFADFAHMMEFWHGRLPFVGHVIHWRFKDARDKT